MDITWTNPNCHHSDACGCKVTVITKCPEFKGQTFTSTASTVQMQYDDVISQMNTFLNRQNLSTPVQEEVSYLLTGLRNDTDMKFIDPPFIGHNPWPEDVPEYHMPSSIHRYFRIADQKYLFMRFPN